MACLCATGQAWSQPGSVLSHQKISDTQGNFTAIIDDADEFGGALADLGDLDGGGPSVRAVAVGCIGDDDGGGNRGAVYVLFLNSAGSVLSHQKISNTEGGFTGMLDNLDDFGSSLAYLGDIDGPGGSVGALAVGAAGDDDGGSARGAVWVLFLNSSGTVMSHQKISDTAGNFTPPLVNADEFGGALASLGDLDGAGPSVHALAVGAIGADDGAINRGATYVLFLASNGTVLSNTKIGNNQGGFNVTLDSADEFGSAVAAMGDLDGAGSSVATLAVGAIGDDDGGSDRGCIYMLFLNSAGTVVSHQKISNTQGGFTATMANLDELGGALANLGDLNGDMMPGVAAMAVGAVGDASFRGAVYVMFLTSSGTVLSHQKIAAMQGGFTGDIVASDEFGGALAALGDLDGAGQARQALVSGATFDDDGGPDRGATYVLFLEGVAPTDVGELPNPPMYVLGQARPNPFNPRTIIPFRLGAAGWVEIGIWDVRGHRVRRLVHGPASLGEHQTAWDGMDDAGRPLPSGAYFYRMSVNGQAVGGAGRAILVK